MNTKHCMRCRKHTTVPASALLDVLCSDCSARDRRWVNAVPPRQPLLKRIKAYFGV